MAGLEFLDGLTSCADSVKNAGAPVYIYGMGNGGEKVLKWCEDNGITPAGVFASDGFVRGQSFCGYRVQSLAQVEEQESDFTVLLAFGTSLPEVMGHIEDIEKRRRLYAPDVSVIGSSAFDRAFLDENKGLVERVCGLFEDELSRRTFAGLCAYKITGELRYLREIFTHETKPSPLLGLGGDEIYCDLGAYNGDTVGQFVKAVGTYKKIYALEPEKRNFQKCVKNCMGLDNIELINSAAWAFDGAMGFSDGSGRQAKLEAGGSGAIAVRSLDSVLGGRECTYIKYDVEGADIPALEGSKQTVKKYRPKLCCALYHRPYDFITIPAYLSENFEGYKYYLRQDIYYPAWETDLYAVRGSDL